MKNDIDIQFLCKDCERLNLCKYYSNRKKDSYICKYFHYVLESHIENILVAFWYNRSIRNMKALCEEIRNRIEKKDCKHTDDGDVLYSVIILMFGEYGTSPRSGWLLNIKPETILEIIAKFEAMYLQPWEDDNE